ncbi:hypothetical protein CEUSTIGMA_g11582.t1 [Chlamydomonas eustigma]|uniref:Glycosyltransferase family 92 protein n=1 Tax=Chlamydomonas eustigma TaxID=1157962 RepID=A0A250XMK6_9CHLO|nr:hypothetical protein CEUSTIGMA_g11582.t1 [Chlamydomonas eustigma]|eukprot:GAX84159.1 hypothetical protein CEUSTIGMA_g11582.t1 [Chlamydomonas eustigma]
MRNLIILLEQRLMLCWSQFLFPNKHVDILSLFIFILKFTLTVQTLPTPCIRPVKNNYSALCVVVKNELRDHVAEWIDYHLCLGVDVIYLYDHESEPPLKQDLIANDASRWENHRVQIQRLQGHHKRFESFPAFPSLERFIMTAQGYAYWQCLHNYGRSHTFMGFLDIDEFIAVTDTEASGINDILCEYERYGGLSIYWRVLGSSGHDARPNSSVLDSYTSCLPHMRRKNRQVKSFVNTKFMPIMHSPHEAVFLWRNMSNMPPAVSSSEEGISLARAFQNLLKGMQGWYSNGSPHTWHPRRKSRAERKIIHAAGAASGNSPSSGVIGSVVQSSLTVNSSSVDHLHHSSKNSNLSGNFTAAASSTTRVGRETSRQGKPIGMMTIELAEALSLKMVNNSRSQLNHLWWDGEGNDSSNNNISATDSGSRQAPRYRRSNIRQRASSVVDRTSGPALVTEKFKPLQEYVRRRATWDRLAVYHYILKSRQDFKAKLDRGAGAGVTRSSSLFDEVDKDANDTCLWALSTRKRFCTTSAATP